MSAQAAHILEIWRSAERLLRVLPPDAPERPEVEERLEQMRALYRQFTSEAMPSTRTRLEARKAIETVQARLDEIARRHAPNQPPG